MSTFEVKTVTLVANIQNTLAWSGSDFQKTLGFAIPEGMLSIALNITNNTGQVCYVGLQYATKLTNYGLNERKSIGAVPANATLRLSSAMAPALGQIGPDVTNIVITLISAGAGTVSIGLETYSTSNNAGSADYQGLDQRSVLDYIPIKVDNFPTQGAGTSTTVTLYTVPAGKRAFVKSIEVSIEPTPTWPGQVEATVDISATTLLLDINSRQFEHNSVIVPYNFPMNANDTLRRTATNNSGSSHNFAFTVYLEETF